MAETKETEKIEGVTTEQKHTTEVKVDMSGMLTEMADVKKELAESKKSNAEIKEILTKLLDQKQTPVVPEVKEDKTKGIVKEDKKVETKVEDGMVIEKADSGKGFQIWRDYSKENCKFKRLAR